MQSLTLRLSMTSVAHLDSLNIVDIGLAHMLSLVVRNSFDAEFDVFFSTSIEIQCFFRVIQFVGVEFSFGVLNLL
ncbi:hypothetical protein Dsin_028639 [Dipteronia sinensis]|uniref:Uncharacterized protein n=1 Tax=Dipteronia sinensis TaxID=43782 RepID=A0AAD9ZR46_9ROSI|nr:hypothetical protein Dsin_028639 [Dipteronia sinensis]